MPDRTLTAAELNRATLDRQLLLDRVRLEPAAAVERLVALQAQEPASPYIALWTRLDGFDPDDLTDAFQARRVVKGTLLRVTLHAVSADDYRHFWPAVSPSLRQWRTPIVRRLGLEADLESLGRQAVAFGSQPRTGAEMRDHMPALEGGLGPAGQSDSWWAVRPLLPFLMAPGDERWAFGRRPRFVAAPAWLGSDLGSAEDGLVHLVRRYLAGFGPAGVDDIHRFSLVRTTPIRAALERIAAEVVRYRDEGGRILYDLADRPLPEPDRPAPVRFLPMWDSLLLAYHDRSRVLPEPYRRRVIQPNGDFLASFMVDGRVAGLWRADLVDGRSKVTALPFEPLAPGDAADVAAEAERLARFLDPVEPAVYARYARTWLGDRP